MPETGVLFHQTEEHMVDLYLWWPSLVSNDCTTVLVTELSKINQCTEKISLDIFTCFSDFLPLRNLISELEPNTLFCLHPWSSVNISRSLQRRVSPMGTLIQKQVEP
jgi:hypothetical protein